MDEKINIQLKINGSETDVSTLLMAKTLTLNESFCNSSYKSTVNSVSFELQFNKLLFQTLLMEENEIEVLIKVNDEIVFMGYMEPVVSTSYSISASARSIYIEAVDFTIKLDELITTSASYPAEVGGSPYFLFKRTNLQQSLIYKILEMAGFADNIDANAPDIPNTILHLAITEKESSYREVLDTLLYENLYTLTSTRDGKITWAKYAYEDIYFKEIIDETKILANVNDFSIDKRYETADGVLVNHPQTKIFDDHLLWRASLPIGNDANVLPGEAIAGNDYWPTDSDIVETWQSFSTKWMDTPYLNKESRIENKSLDLIASSNHYIKVGKDDEIVTDPINSEKDVIYEAKRARLRYKNISTSAKKIYKCEIYGKALGITSVAETAYPELSKNPKVYSTMYTYDSAIAMKLAKAQYTQLKRGIWDISFSSLEDYLPGSVLYLVQEDFISLHILITSANTPFNSSKIKSYKAISIESIIDEEWGSIVVKNGANGNPIPSVDGKTAQTFSISADYQNFHLDGNGNVIPGQSIKIKASLQNIDAPIYWTLSPNLKNIPVNTAEFTLTSDDIPSSFSSLIIRAVAGAFNDSLKIKTIANGKDGEDGKPGDKGQDLTGFSLSASPGVYELSSRGMLLEYVTIKVKIDTTSGTAVTLENFRNSLGLLGVLSAEGEYVFTIPKESKHNFVEVFCTFDGASKKIEIRGVVTGKLTYYDLGVHNITDRPINSDTATPEGPLIEGDFYLEESLNNEGILESYPVVWNGERWEEATKDTKHWEVILQSVLPSALASESTIKSGTFLYGYFNQLAANKAFIESLVSKLIKLKDGGAIYAGGYDEKGDNASGIDGFYLGADGKFKAVSGTLKNVSIEGDGTFQGEIDSPVFKTVNASEDGDTFTLDLLLDSYQPPHWLLSEEVSAIGNKNLASCNAAYNGVSYNEYIVGNDARDISVFTAAASNNTVTNSHTVNKKGTYIINVNAIRRSTTRDIENWVVTSYSYDWTEYRYTPYSGWIVNNRGSSSGSSRPKSDKQPSSPSAGDTYTTYSNIKEASGYWEKVGTETDYYNGAIYVYKNDVLQFSVADSASLGTRTLYCEFGNVIKIIRNRPSYGSNEYSGGSCSIAFRPSSNYNGGITLFNTTTGQVARFNGSYYKLPIAFTSPIAYTTPLTWRQTNVIKRKGVNITVNNPTNNLVASANPDKSSFNGKKVRQFIINNGVISVVFIDDTSQSISYSEYAKNFTFSIVILNKVKGTTVIGTIDVRTS